MALCFGAYICGVLQCTVKDTSPNLTTYTRPMGGHPSGTIWCAAAPVPTTTTIHMVHHSTPWCTTIHHGAPPYTMVRHHTPWCHGAPPYTIDHVAPHGTTCSQSSDRIIPQQPPDGLMTNLTLLLDQLSWLQFLGHVSFTLSVTAHG